MGWAATATAHPPTSMLQPLPPAPPQSPTYLLQPLPHLHATAHSPTSMLQPLPPVPTQCLCPCSTANCWPVCGSHSMVHLSREHEARRLPSGEKHTLVMVSVWPGGGGAGGGGIRLGVREEGGDINAGIQGIRLGIRLGIRSWFTQHWFIKPAISLRTRTHTSTHT